jgi:hypothetical protein
MLHRLMRWIKRELCWPLQIGALRRRGAVAASSGITLSQAQEHLDAWLAADLAVSRGQSYMIGTRRLDRTHAQEIRNNVDYWETKVKQLSRSGQGIRIVRGIVGW